MRCVCNHYKTNKHSDLKIKNREKQNVFQPIKNTGSRLFNLKTDGENLKSFLRNIFQHPKPQTEEEHLSYKQLFSSNYSEERTEKRGTRFPTYEYVNKHTSFLIYATIIIVVV